MPATPEKSQGARTERAAFRAYLNRRIKSTESVFDKDSLEEILEWVLKRQERYEAKTGGLGRKISRKAR